MHKALQLTISDDQMTAYITVKKAVLEKQKELTYPGLPDVLTACEEWNVVYGIDNDKIVKNLKLKDQPFVIAHGKALIQTITDKVSYTFEDLRNKKFTPSILQDEKANFYDMVNFQMVQKNELLVFIKKGRAGTNGLTVTGKEIQAERYVEITVDLLRKFCGSNTQLAPEGIIATVTGIPMIAPDGKAHVDETYVIGKDVDFATGSVSYEGPIIVKGAVTNNFTVKTPKDVIVEGIVDGGIIEAGGLVSLLGGINKGKVISKKNVVAKYIYASHIQTDATVIVDEAILNSLVKAKTIIAKGEPNVAKSGQISGGKVIANNFIWAKSVGSPSSNYTEAIITSFVDISPLEKLQEDEKKLQQDLAKVYKMIQGIQELKKKAENVPPNLQANEVKLLKLKLALETNLKKFKNEISIIEKAVDKELEESMRRVFVTIALYPKVLIQVMQMKALTKQDYGPTIALIDKEDGTLKLSPATEKMELPKEFQSSD